MCSYENYKIGGEKYRDLQAEGGNFKIRKKGVDDQF